MIVAIDGPSGVGKSTVSRYCADTLSFKHINSGQYYRAVVHYINSVSDNQLADAEIAHHSNRLATEWGIVKYIATRCNDSSELYSLAIDKKVALISTSATVRALVNSAIRTEVGNSNAIVEGRDIGSVVYPHAELKVFLSATTETRLHRRASQRGGEVDTTQEYRTMNLRDSIDTNRSVGALRVAQDATVIDTTHLTFSHVCRNVLQLVSMRYNTDHATV